VDQVVPARFGFGGAIAGLIRPEHEDLPRTPLGIQERRVVEAPPEHGRGDAIVLGGAEDRDRVNRLDVARAVVVGGTPDDERRSAHDDQGSEEDERDRAEEGMPADAAHRPSLAT
jgi:hypothetical protein